MGSSHALPGERAANREESKREKSEAFAEKFKKQPTNLNKNNENNSGNNNSKEFVNKNQSKSKEFGEKTSGMPATNVVVREANVKDAVMNNVFPEKNN